ncbi:MAG: SoxR reducing system RseC family protein [Prevotella sp.]|nr:SoxR reducing system RseC family protein [Prevotella sp.]
MSNKIRHAGVIESVGDDCIKVRILQTSACGACKVAGHCNASQSKEKLIDVYHQTSSDFHVGEHVTVVASPEVGMRAIAWGFGIPFILLVATVFLMVKLTGNEGLAALTSLGALIPYYLVLYVLRDKIRERLSFSIERE